jgi:methionyl-tRNA formyltransferase
MGTPALAAHILERLLDSRNPNVEVVAVVTRPDRPQGRGLKLEQSEVAAVATAHGLPLLKPEKIKTENFTSQLKSFDPDILIVAAYGRILPASVLQTPRRMPINVHASLLPRHRGASPIEAAILAGDPLTGITIMRITGQMDAGPMLLQSSLPIAADETQASLKDKLAELGATTLLDALDQLAAGQLHETAQDDALATYTSLIKKADARIDWSADAIRIERMIRAFDPWPVAHTMLDGQELRIYRARVEDEGDVSSHPVGTISRLDPALVVRCDKGLLCLLEVQAAGRKRMSAAEFARGRRLAVGQRLGE